LGNKPPKKNPHVSGDFSVNGSSGAIFSVSALSPYGWTPRIQIGYRGTWGGSSYDKLVKEINTSYPWPEGRSEEEYRERREKSKEDSRVVR
jgi:hypothetical protein